MKTLITAFVLSFVAAPALADIPTTCLGPESRTEIEFHIIRGAIDATVEMKFNGVETLGTITANSGMQYTLTSDSEELEAPITLEYNYLDATAVLEVKGSKEKMFCSRY